MTQQIGLLGYPVSHSISPIFQQSALDHCSIDARYVAWSVRPEDLQGQVEKLRADEYLGAGVTIPYKERVMPFLDSVDSTAFDIGAVNTIVNDQGRLVGYNTDVHGFMQGLRWTAKFHPEGKRVLVIGAGGAARAGVFGLVRSGVALVTVANRTEERARSLVREFTGTGVDRVAIGMDGGELGIALSQADLVVNATSVGMLHGTAEGVVPFELDSIRPTALVYDMVYTPQDTPFLMEARMLGANTIGGLPMLVYQGAKSFKLWTSVDAPIEVMFNAASNALSG